MQEDIDEVAKRFRIKKFGYIATGYTNEQEDLVYKCAAKILANKYSNIISEEELYNRITKQGHIYTVTLCKNRIEIGFLEKSTGHIGITYFLKKMTENLLHEIVHRIRI